MKSINSALQRMLRQHEPFPTIVMDRYWNVLLTNDAAPQFFNCFIDMSARQGRRNPLHLTFDPAGMGPFMVNWHEAARSLIARVHREALGHIIDVNTRRLPDELSKSPGVAPEWRTPTPADAMPAIPWPSPKAA